jgi:DNA polymerase (family X)
MEKEKRTTNAFLVEMFNKIADLLEIKGEVIYKILAYRRAAESIRDLDREVVRIWEEGQLTEIPGVGKAIAEKIDEIIRTSKLEFLEKLKIEIPESLVELLRVPDLGPKKVATLWKAAGIISLDQLEAGAKAGKLRDLPGFGEKSEQKIIAGLEALSRQSGRIPIGKAWLFCERLAAFLSKVDGVERLEYAGSLRRRKETIGDIDLLISTRTPKPVMQAFTSHPDVVRIVGQGEVKSSVEFANGIRVQLWCADPGRFGTALQYATGSKEHNVKLREFANDAGYSISEHAITKENGQEFLFATEGEVYNFLGLPYIPPELREDRGEIQAARSGNLPVLIELSDIRSEFHVHTTWSDGKLTIREMAQEAIQRGMKILAITDHSGSLGVAGGLSIDELRDQKKEIEAIQLELGDRLKLLHGSEIEILADGSLDYPDEILAELDLVIASLHSSLRQPRDKITERLIRAIQNPHVDVIGHPTGRMIPDREGADLDMDAVFKAALEAGVAMELNAHPARLDLNDANARRAADLGIPLMINTDAHTASDLDLLHFGIGIARRAWLQKEQVMNAWDSQRILSWLAKRNLNAVKG